MAATYTCVDGSKREVCVTVYDVSTPGVLGLEVAFSQTVECVGRVRVHEPYCFYHSYPLGFGEDASVAWNNLSVTARLRGCLTLDKFCQTQF